MSDLAVMVSVGPEAEPPVRNFKLHRLAGWRAGLKLGTRTRRRALTAASAFQRRKRETPMNKGFSGRRLGSVSHTGVAGFAEMLHPPVNATDTRDSVPSERHVTRPLLA